MNAQQSSAKITDGESELFGHVGQDLHDLTKMNKIILKNPVNPVKAYRERSDAAEFSR